jgi:lysozyme
MKDEKETKCLSALCGLSQQCGRHSEKGSLNFFHCVVDGSHGLACRMRVFMNAIDILTNLIKQFEGCKLKAYRCPANVLTIGYGHTGQDVTEGLEWSQQFADAILRKDADKYLEQALDASPVLRAESASHQAAIADFVYNCGLGNYKSSTLKKKVDARNWSAAQVEIVKWNKGGGKVLKGLVTRREAERKLLEI